MTNQLVEAAEAIPDINEYDGIATRDVAAAVIYADEGSEEQLRALAVLRARAPRIGDNRAPLGESLVEETRALQARADELVELARGVIIPDGNDEAAAKVGDVIGLIKALEAEAEQTKLKRSKPFRDGWKLINDHFARLVMPLVLARGGESGKDGLVGQLTEHANRREARIEAERKAALAEQKERERVAAEAARRAEEAAAKGSGAATAQLDLLQAREEADRAAARAAAIRPTPIRSHLGTVVRRRDPKHQITDPMKFAGWLIEQPTYKNHFLQALSTIAGQVTRGAGIDAVGEGLDIPGLKTWVEQGAANVRR